MCSENDEIVVVVFVVQLLSCLFHILFGTYSFIYVCLCMYVYIQMSIMAIGHGAILERKKGERKIAKQNQFQL